MKRYLCSSIVAFSLVFCQSVFVKTLMAQVPPNSFYHDRSSILPYAKLTATREDGSKNQIPFTLLIVNKSPTGISDFSNDIDLYGKLVFAGNGIVDPRANQNIYGNYNLAGRIPLIVYNYPLDFQSRIGEKSDLHVRAYEAEIRGATALVVFGFPDSDGWKSPFVELPETIPPISIPVVLISFSEADALLRSSDIELDSKGRDMETVIPDTPLELPVDININIKGDFESIISDHFTINYLPGLLNSRRMSRYVNDMESAVTYSSEFLKLDSLENLSINTTYFPDYTSLRFYTNISKNNSMDYDKRYEVFSVIQGLSHPIQNEYYHIVSDISTTVLIKAFGVKDTYISAGFGSMLGDNAAGSSGSDINRLTAQWISEGQIIPLASIFIEPDYGITPESEKLIIETGSFLKFLYLNYGFDKFRKTLVEISKADGANEKIEAFNDDLYLKTFANLEMAWIEGLAFQYDLPSDMVDKYLLESESMVQGIIKNNR